MYPDAAFQARVEAAIVRLEDDRGGAVCPIRRVPIDMVAHEIARDLGVPEQLFTALGFVTDRLIDDAVAAMIARFLGGPDARLPNTETHTLTGDPIGPVV